MVPKAVYPDDKALLYLAAMKAAADLYHKSPVFDMEFRIFHRDGQVQSRSP